MSIAYLEQFAPDLGRHGQVYRDLGTGKVYVTIPERIPNVEEPDNRIHVCRGGETILDVTVLFFKDVFPCPVDIWPVVAQFQEEPILDPFLPLDSGRVLTIPSPDFVRNVAYGDSLAEFPVI
jgi:hypothetical protein